MVRDGHQPVGMVGMRHLRRTHLQGIARASLTAVALLLLASPALAQSAPTNRVTEIATYQGADREQRLIEGAKKEKELTFYASVPPDDIAALVTAFDKKYGVKVRVWRADSESVLQRIVNEARARRYEVDIMVASSSTLEPLYRENLLQEVKSPVLAEIIPEAIAPHRQWAAVYLNTIVQAYNTNLVSKESLPKTYNDLLRPEWKGRLGIEAEDYDWFAQVVLDLGEERGLRLFRSVVAANGISVRKGHNLLTNLVAAGEVPFALTVYGFLAEQAKRKGAPLDWFAIPPAIARATAEGLARNAPHPHAAVLFHDFLLGEGQQILASRQFVTVSRKIEQPLIQGPLKLIDSAVMLDQAKKWQELYQRTIIGPSR
ncbi:MAG TPA: extracellular solute-binding protein [Xanthobacteraceae bacterium]|nr:extracellular solute-binding protein [Xanthobacteraceae bacterium]